MKLDISNIKFSNNDLKLNIRLPTELDFELAYFMGFHYGDGYMKKEIRGKTVDFRLSYNGNKENEYVWYVQYIKPLIKRLFNKDVNVKKTKAGTVRIEFRSKAIFHFLNNICLIPESPKKNMKVPNLIKKSKDEMKKAFIRGISDTDFSITFKNRRKIKPYPMIDYQTSDELLRNSISEYIKNFGFNLVMGKRKRSRKNNTFYSYYIQINGRENLKKWNKEIGTSSFKNKEKIIDFLKK